MAVGVGAEAACQFILFFQEDSELEQLILVCVGLLAVGLALALVRERRLRIALQLLLRRYLSLRRNEHVEKSGVSVDSDPAGAQRL